MRFNFKDSSLKQVFIIKREEVGLWNQQDMEYFMERVRQSLMVPPQYFNNENNGN